MAERRQWLHDERQDNKNDEEIPEAEPCPQQANMRHGEPETDQAADRAGN
jgi:hypothetical protein